MTIQLSIFMHMQLTIQLYHIHGQYNRVYSNDYTIDYIHS